MPDELERRSGAVRSAALRVAQAPGLGPQLRSTRTSAACDAGGPGRSSMGALWYERQCPASPTRRRSRRGAVADHDGGAGGRLRPPDVRWPRASLTWRAALQRAPMARRSTGSSARSPATVVAPDCIATAPWNDGAASGSDEPPAAMRQSFADRNIGCDCGRLTHRIRAFPGGPRPGPFAELSQ